MMNNVKHSDSVIGESDTKLQPRMSAKDKDKINGGNLSRALNQGGIKSARSFTQYKDLEVGRDKKSTTQNFAHGPDAIKGLNSEILNN